MLGTLFARLCFSRGVKLATYVVIDQCLLRGHHGHNRVNEFNVVRLQLHLLPLGLLQAAEVGGHA